MSKLKKFIAVMLATLCVSTPVFANTISVNGVNVQQDSIIHQGKTYVPMRAIAEMLGAEVNYDSKTGNTNLLTKIDPKTSQAVITVRLADLLVTDTIRLIENLQMLKYEVILSEFGISLKDDNLTDAYNDGLQTISDRLSMFSISYEALNNITPEEFAKSHNLYGAYSSLGIDTVEATTRIEKLRKTYSQSIAEETLSWIDSALDAAWYIVSRVGQLGDDIWNELPLS